MKTQRYSIHVVVLVLAVCLSACAGKSASSNFYVLSPLPQSKLSGSESKTIGVFPVAMPDYLDRPQIVTRVSENEIKLDEFSRWAEPLKRTSTPFLLRTFPPFSTPRRSSKQPKIWASR